MAIQIIRRELNPLYLVRPFAFVFLKLPVEIVRQELIEVSLGVIISLFFMSLYYRLVRRFYPILIKLDSRLTRNMSFRLSMFLYEKVVPPPGKLLRVGYQLYRRK